MTKFIKNQKSKETGFTLIEMLVAIFIFSIVMTIAVGAIFSIVSANKTSQALKSVMDNLNSSLDDMSSSIRYGSNYHCGAGNDTTHAVSCAGGGTSISFLSKDGITLITYNFDSAGHKIQECLNGDVCEDLTAPEIVVEDVHFYVTGATDGSSVTADAFQQPQVLMTISGYAQNGGSQSNFSIETMITQRNPACKTEMKSANGRHPAICLDPNNN